MCQYCHIEGNNPYTVEHSTFNCHDSRNPYKGTNTTLEGRIAKTLRQQFARQEPRSNSQEYRSNTSLGIGLTPFGPVLFAPIQPPTGFIPVMVSPGNFLFMPVFH